MNSNEEWLLTNKEEALEPNLPICDPHHHLWDFNKTYIEETYLLPDILKDTESGHNIVSTVFIECGANDGVDQSNTWYYEKNLNWSGILIEPLKKQFWELKKNRSKKNKFFNLALCSSENENTLLIEDDDLKSKSCIENNKKINSNIKSVNSITLTRILDEISAPNLIDFFSLDVEGFEANVISGGQNTLEQYSPKIMIELDFVRHPKSDVDTLKSIFDRLDYTAFEYTFKKGKLSMTRYNFQDTPKGRNLLLMR